MQNTTLFRRMAALLLTVVLAVSAALPGLAVDEMPIQTANEGESIYLFNADIDKPILDQNAGQQRYIASLTKMMTALLFLESGKDLNEEITIPTSLTQEFKDIQNANGSTMNLRIGETVRRIDLLYGQSAQFCRDDEPEGPGAGLHQHQLHLCARPVRLRQRLLGP